MHPSHEICILEQDLTNWNRTRRTGGGDQHGQGERQRKPTSETAGKTTGEHKQVHMEHMEQECKHHHQTE